MSSKVCHGLFACLLHKWHSKLHEENNVGPSLKRNKFDTSSDEGSDINCTEKEKELVDYMLDRCRKANFEVFNIIVCKLDKIQEQKCFPKTIIKQILEELDKIIQEGNRRKRRMIN